MDICHDAEVEPTLEPLSGVMFSGKSNAREDEARLDISTCGLWAPEDTF